MKVIWIGLVLGALAARSPAATLAGTVRDDQSSAAIAARVEVFDPSGARRALQDTPNGVFRIDGLPAGRYYLKLSAAGHIAESFPDIRCFADECDVRFGRPFELAESSLVENLEAFLAPWATLRIATVDAGNGAPIFPDLFVIDAANGNALNPFHDHPYLAEYFAMAPGAYYVATHAAGYALEGADGSHLASRRPEDVVAAQPLLLQAGQTLDVEIALDRLGKVHGDVGAPGCRVLAYRPDADRAAAEGACAAGPGTFTLELPPSPHQLLFTAPGRAARFHGNIPCQLDADDRPLCRRDLAPAVAVPLGGQLTLPALVLPAAGGIRGRVFAPAGLEAIARLRLYDANGILVADTTAGPAYFFEGLNPGAYFLEGIGEPPAGRRIWPDLDCRPAACAPLAGQPIVVAAGAIREPIDLALPLAPGSPPSFCSLSDENSLCLVDERFRVDAAWQTLEGTGAGRSVRLSADTGAFWFFSPDNLELTVKVLDGCAINGHYWVFAAGLTNVGVDLRVADTVTDRVKTYQNPLGQGYAPILDTAAFTCWN